MKLIFITIISTLFCLNLFSTSNIEATFDNMVESKNIEDLQIKYKLEIETLSSLKDIKSLKYIETTYPPKFESFETQTYNFNQLGYLTTYHSNHKDSFKDNKRNITYTYSDKMLLIKEQTDTLNKKIFKGEVQNENENSNITEYKYDDKGNLIKKFDPKSLGQTIFEYDTNNRVIKKEQTFSDLNKHIFKYNYKDNLLDRVEITYISDEKTEYLVNKYNYLENNNLIISQINQEGNEIIRNEITLDSKNRKTLLKEFQGDNLDYHYEYKYDNNDNLILSASIDCGTNWGSQWFGKTTWDYNSDNKLIRESEYSDDNDPSTNLEFVETVSYIYNKNHVIIIRKDERKDKITSTTEKNYKDSLLDTQIYSYYSSNGELYSLETTKYTYSKNQIKSLTTNIKGEVIKESVLSIEYY